MVAEVRTRSARAEAFFEKGAFYVQERRGARGERSAIYNSKGEPLGSVVQQVNFGKQFVRIFLKSSLLPFRIEIRDTSDQRIASIRRGWTIVRSRIEILDAQDDVIGFLKHKENSRKPRIKVFNDEGRKIGELAGNQATWDMNIIDPEYVPFGHITEYAPETTPGATTGKETYFVSVDNNAISGPERQVILTTAIAIERLLHENLLG
jgi:uncharacterized protein YxjI